MCAHRPQTLSSANKGLALNRLHATHHPAQNVSGECASNDENANDRCSAPTSHHALEHAQPNAIRRALHSSIMTMTAAALATCKASHCTPFGHTSERECASRGESRQQQWQFTQGNKASMYVPIPTLSATRTSTQPPAGSKATHCTPSSHSCERGCTSHGEPRCRQKCEPAVQRSPQVRFSCRRAPHCRSSSPQHSADAKMYQATVAEQQPREDTKHVPGGGVARPPHTTTTVCTYSYEAARPQTTVNQHGNHQKAHSPNYTRCRCSHAHMRKQPSCYNTSCS